MESLIYRVSLVGLKMLPNWKKIRQQLKFVDERIYRICVYQAGEKKDRTLAPFAGKSSAIGPLSFFSVIHAVLSAHLPTLKCRVPNWSCAYVQSVVE